MSDLCILWSVVLEEPPQVWFATNHFRSVVIIKGKWASDWLTCWLSVHSFSQCVMFRFCAKHEKPLKAWFIMWLLAVTLCLLVQDGDNPRPKKKKKLMKKKTKRRGEDFQICQEQILLLPVSIYLYVFVQRSTQVCLNVIHLPVLHS